MVKEIQNVQQSLELNCIENLMSLTLLDIIRRDLVILFFPSIINCSLFWKRLNCRIKYKMLYSVSNCFCSQRVPINVMAPVHDIDDTQKLISLYRFFASKKKKKYDRMFFAVARQYQIPEVLSTKASILHQRALLWEERVQKKKGYAIAFQGLHAAWIRIQFQVLGATTEALECWNTHRHVCPYPSYIIGRL